jgi:predicted RNA-binding Zn-ribbon protein involved in translation (DUF1610 family)
MNQNPDVHCQYCQQVIVPHDMMRPLMNWREQAESSGLNVIHTGTMIMTNADFICPTCGRMVYFRLSEQRINLLLEKLQR